MPRIHLPSRKRPLGRLLRNRTAIAGLIICGVVCVAALFAPWLSPHPPLQINMQDRFAPPSPRHWMGADDLGRDVFSRLLYGARVSILTGVFSVALGGVIGAALGLISAFSGGSVDNLVMRFMDGLLAFPPVLLALSIVAALGASATNVILAISVIYVPTFARAARGAALPVKQLEFVTATRAVGASEARILIRTILPNCLSPILVQASIGFASAVLIEAALSFLSLGVQPPAPSWGNMLNVGRVFLDHAPWISLASGGAIFLLVLGVNLLGDAIRDALDPRLAFRA